MKKLLVVVMMWSASLGAMEIPVEQQQQLQEGMITVDFGDKSSQEVARKYVLLSSVLKNQIEDTDGYTVLVPHKSAFELLGSYLPKLYELQQATSNQDRERIRNELKALLTRKQPKELVVTNEQLGMIATIADYLEIEVMFEIVLEICRDRLASDTNIKDQFLTSKNPEAFNPFGLDKELLGSLKEKLVQLLYVPGHTLMGHDTTVQSVAWSPDGMLAAGSGNGTIKLWQQQANQWMNVHTLTGHRDYVDSVAWNQDGMLASGSGDTTTRVWQQQNGTWVNEVMPPVLLTVIPGGVQGPSAPVLLTVALMGRGPYFGETQESVDSVAWSPDGTLASTSFDKIYLREQQNGQWVNVHRLLTGHEKTVMSVAFSPDGMTLASGSADGTIKLWQQKNGQWVNVHTLSHGEMVISIAFSPDGTTLASGGASGIIKLWQQKNGQWVNVHTLSHGGMVMSVAWSPDGTMLASGAGDKTIKLWQKKNDQWVNVQRLRGHKNWVKSVAWSPDGMTLASGSLDKTITLWGKIPAAAISDMSFPEALLVFYAEQALTSNPQQFDLAQYPKLLELYKSLIETLSDKPEIKKYITTLFKVANMQP